MVVAQARDLDIGTLALQSARRALNIPNAEILHVDITSVFSTMDVPLLVLVGQIHLVTLASMKLCHLLHTTALSLKQVPSI